MFEPNVNFTEQIKDYMQALGGQRFHNMNAFIVNDANGIHFYSYTTWIATIKPNTTVVVNGRFDCYSPTTSRQFGRFLREYTSLDLNEVKWAFKELSKGGYSPVETGEYICASADDFMCNYVGFVRDFQSFMASISK